MKRDFCVRNHSPEFPAEVVRADDARVRQLADLAGKFDLNRPQPKGASPRRSGRVELVENCHQATAVLIAKRPQYREQTKRNTALLEAIIYIMQDEVIE